VSTFRESFNKVLESFGKSGMSPRIRRSSFKDRLEILLSFAQSDNLSKVVVSSKISSSEDLSESLLSVFGLNP